MLYDHLSGTARLPSTEEQLTLLLEGNGRGGISVSGIAWFIACYGSNLTFEFDIDQTYLPSVLKQLATVNGVLQADEGLGA